MFFRNRCYKGGKLHSFQPRFDRVEHKGVPTVKSLPAWVSPDDMVPIMEASREAKVTVTYLCDVCEWCGEVIYRDGRPKQKADPPKQYWKIADIEMNRNHSYFSLMIGRKGTCSPAGQSDDGVDTLVDFLEDGEVVPIQAINLKRLERA